MLISSKGLYQKSNKFDSLDIQCQEEQVVLSDFDGDMDLDVFFACNSFFGKTRNYLLENAGNGSFIDVTIGSGIELFNQEDNFRVEGAQAFDYDGNDLPDIYEIIGSIVIVLSGIYIIYRETVKGVRPFMKQDARFRDKFNRGH